MNDCRPVTTPAIVEPRDENLRDRFDQRKYQELVRALLFFSTRTRPNIAIAVNLLSRNCADPRESHMRSAKRVLRYLRGTSQFILRLCGIGVESTRLIAYSDANWEGDLSDRKSTTGTVITLRGTAILWNSNKQRSVALSSTETEHIAASETTKMIIWIQALLKEFDFGINSPTIMNMDNQGAIYWATDGVRHAKHVDIRKNFVMDMTEKGNLRIEYCPTEKMLAYIFTKPLMRIKFEKNRESIGVDFCSRDTSKKGT